ncbi:MAG: hypothetical protein IIX01_00225 [Clostridia bacterium]|nr:hypothetical protein [Clostridia bacterium]
MFAENDIAKTGERCYNIKEFGYEIQNVLITHAHQDHYVPISSYLRGDCFAHNLAYEKMYFYGPENLERIYDAVALAYGGVSASIRQNVGFVATEDQTSYRVGRYVVTALKALHAPQLGCLNYVIEDGEKSLLYLLDSGYPTEETLAFLGKRNKPFDCVVMDGTMGVAPAKSYIYHMGFDENKELKKELIARGIANENTRFVVTHITHNKAETHEKIEKLFEGTDIDVAYDGYELVF